jgi:hypothetical protein
LPDPNTFEIIDVNASNVDETGFFCCMSKRKSEGYQNKLAWLKDRFAEGLKIKMLGGGLRGFIEYIPGEYAWRAVNADGYMFIHCIWVVGKSKKKGYSVVLLNECLKDAREAGMNGVAVVTGEGNYLVGKKLFLKHGFEVVDEAPPAFSLLVKKFNDSPDPFFGIDWGARQKACGDGLTMFRAHQCPYLEDSVNVILETAEERGIPAKVIDLNTRQDVLDKAPTAYGIFSVVYNGQLLEYWPVWKAELEKRLGRMG